MKHYLMKCIYREKIADPQHCDKPADYIYIGKSYCAEHMKIRSDEGIAYLEEEKREGCCEKTCLYPGDFVKAPGCNCACHREKCEKCGQLI